MVEILGIPGPLGKSAQHKVLNITSFLIGEVDEELPRKLPSFFQRKNFNDWEKHDVRSRLNLTDREQLIANLRPAARKAVEQSTILIKEMKGKERQPINRPFPSSLGPLFQSESKCETILIKMTLIFVLRLVLKQRHKRTRKWPIDFLRVMMTSGFSRGRARAMTKTIEPTKMVTILQLGLIG